MQGCTQGELRNEEKYRIGHQSNEVGKAVEVPIPCS